jgi:hypothetical protein
MAGTGNVARPDGDMGDHGLLLLTIMEVIASQIVTELSTL